MANDRKKTVDCLSMGQKEKRMCLSSKQYTVYTKPAAMHPSVFCMLSRE